MSHSSRFIISVFLAEFLGTFFLVFIGDGAIASFTIKRQAPDFFAICLNFGIGAMLATFISGKISGAHINPAGTLAQALAGNFSWSLVPVYMIAQYLGGFMAALALYINYAEGIADLDGGLRSTYGDPAGRSTGGIFATYPGPYVTIFGSLLDQVLGTFILVFALCALTDPKNAALEKRHQPLAIALTICGVCMAFLPNCGAIFNPARDLAPRLLTLVVGYRDPSPFAPISGLYWLMAGLVGPHLGAILAVFGYKYTVAIWLESRPNEYDLDMIDHEERDAQQQLAASKSAGPALRYGAGQTRTSSHNNTDNFGSAQKNYPECISYGGGGGGNMQSR